MEKHRPINGLEHLIGDNVVRLSKTEYRFVKLLKTVDAPISEQKIINFYNENVKSNVGRFVFENGGWVQYEYSTQEIRIKALTWFDRNLGTMIRKNILSKQGNEVMKLLTGIK